MALRHPAASFVIRIDVAGPYADNLLHFLHHLADPAAPNPGPLAGRTIIISCGDPQRNKNYRAALLAAARTSIASLGDLNLADLVRDQVRQMRDIDARQQRLEELLVRAYRALPKPNHLASIPGIGEVTAAVLTAFILDIDRFV